MSKALAFLTGAAIAVGAIGGAAAHTTSLGFVPGGNAGEVTFWTGSYGHGGTPANEGSGQLTGISVSYDQTQPFNLGPVNSKPAGLIDGTNNFFWAADQTFPHSVDPVLFGGVVVWQGVTFTGLVPGTYSFTCGQNCGVTQQWATFGAGAVQVTLRAGDIGGGGGNEVPAPATAALLLAGLAGLALRKRG